MLSNSKSLEELFRKTKQHRIADIESHADLGRAIDKFLFHPENHHENLVRWLAFCGFDHKTNRKIVEGWKAAGRRPAQNRLSFVSYFAKVEAYFLVGLSNSVITTRASNQIDMEYIKYLPFCEAFSSGDKLHASVFPYFSKDWQSYVSNQDLKSALREIADHWSLVVSSGESRGTYFYANFPPASLNNAVTEIFDKRLPEWREHSKIERHPLTAEERKRSRASIEPILQALERHNLNG
jgi:hypothetical protein